MLTAYSYYEPTEEAKIQKKMKQNPFFLQELEIAEDYVRENNYTKKERTCCPMCGSEEIRFFYEKWRVVYQRCERCFSVFTNTDESGSAAYQNNSELIRLRTSAAYQEYGLEARKNRWIEQIDWIKFRSFRYLKKTPKRVLDIGTRWTGLTDMTRDELGREKYQVERSILFPNTEAFGTDEEKWEIVLAMDYLQQEAEPEEFFSNLANRLRRGGLLFISTKLGSGIDILTLRENNTSVYPYEHIMLPSRKGVQLLLEKVGFEVLEFTTPGTFDLNYIKENKEDLGDSEYFLKYFLSTASPSAEADFQRFIQKSGLSSYAQIVARKR